MPAPLGVPYWTEGVPPAPDLPRDLTAVTGAPGAVVVGGGYTGLSAALTLAREGVRVLVLDAGEPGLGASTRNGGMIGAPHAFGTARTVKGYGLDFAGRLMREGREAYEFTAGLASGLDCDFRRHGRLRLAWTKRHFEALRAEAELMRTHGDYDVQVLGRDELAQEIGSSRYFGGVLFPDHGGLHPHRFHRGLLSAALAEGVQVVAHCPVTRIARTRDRFAVTTAAGRIETDAVIVATNGYTPWSFRHIAERVFPVPSFIIATEPLPEGMADRLAPGRRMMAETRRRYGYFRLSPDGTRLLWGGRAAVHPIPLARARERLRGLMAEVFPALARQPISHVWMGTLGFTFDGLPHVGRRSGVHFALGYNGNGVALSPWLGRKAALRALGRPEGETVFAETKFETRPWRWPMRWTMPLATWMQRPIDWRENAEAERDRAAG